MSDISKIDEVLGNFDFFKVWATMHALDWRWASSNQPPTISRLKEVAKSLLISASEVSEVGETTLTCSTGGLQATCKWTPEGKVFWLGFVVSEWSTDYDHF